MSVKSINDPNFTEVLDAGTYADSHNVNCSPEHVVMSDEQRDIYSAAFDATLDVNLEGKDGLVDGHQETPEAAGKRDDQSTRSKLFHCQMAFLPATIGFDTENFASSFVQNLIENNGIAINSSNRAEANEILGETDDYLANNPEDAARVQSLYDVAARNENGQVFLTNEEKDAWEAENLNVCTMNPTAEDIVDHVQTGRDSILAHLESTEPTGNTQFAKVEFGLGDG